MCKNCCVWTHAYDEIENWYAIVLNNQIKGPKEGIL